MWWVQVVWLASIQYTVINMPAPINGDDNALQAAHEEATADMARLINERYVEFMQEKNRWLVVHFHTGMLIVVFLM